MKYPILAATVIALSMTACSETSKTGNVTGDEDTAVLLQNDVTTKNDGQPGETGSPSDDANWNDIDRINAPAMQATEITDRDVEVRGNEQYGVYSIGENILFDTDKATLRSQAEPKLKSIVASIKQRYADGRIRVFGFADARGDANYNKELSERRAEAVRAYLKNEGGLTDERVTVEAMGEAAPVASNATAEGRQQNRRVQIVARK